MSILVLIQASTGATWYNIDTVLIYYGIQVGISVLYTVLVANRLIVMRNEIKRIMGEYSTIYDTVILMIVESTMIYTPIAILFILAYALHSPICNLCFLGISHIQVSKRKPNLSASLMYFYFPQGIAQLLIIVRVADGRSITHEWSSGHAATPSTIAFSRTTADPTEGTTLESISKPTQDGLELPSLKVEVV